MPLLDCQNAVLAEALVGSIICPGVDDVLTYAPRTVTLRLADERPAPTVPAFGWHRISARRLGAWPITALTSVTVGGTDVTADCTFDRFGIQRNAPQPEFPPFAEITVVFATGFKENSDPRAPTSLLAALEATASLLSSNSSGVLSKTLGEVSVRYGFAVGASTGANGRTQALPEHIMQIIRPYCLETYA